MTNEQVKSALMRLMLLEKLFGENIENGYSPQNQKIIDKVKLQTINAIQNNNFFNEDYNIEEGLNYAAYVPNSPLDSKLITCPETCLQFLDKLLPNLRLKQHYDKNFWTFVCPFGKNYEEFCYLRWDKNKARYQTTICGLSGTIIDIYKFAFNSNAGFANVYNACEDLYNSL